MKMYSVGGCVRDEIMGRKSNDVDFSVVLSPDEIPDPNLLAVPADPFKVMVRKLEEDGIRIIRNEKTGEVIGAEHLTARGISPTRGAVDFVLARRDGDYSDGRRPDSVEIGTLDDDLARRDFRMNAIAKDAAGNFVDPFNGRQDINERVIRAVGNAFDRLSEDALRAVRALRFSVTLGFRIDHEVAFAMQSAAVLNSIQTKIADERIKDELHKMFKFDTMKSLNALHDFPLLTQALFDGQVWLAPTMKGR